MLQANRFHLHKHFDAREPQHDSADLFVGVDVGKGDHRAVALDRTGKRLSNNALPNDETKLRALITELKAHGQLLFVVDKPVTIGAVPLADARDEPSLKRLPARCRTRCAHFDSLTSRSPNSRCCATLTTIPPQRPTNPVTGFVVCSPRSIPHWSVVWDHAWTIPPRARPA